MASFVGRHVQIVANAFYVVAATLGLPALIVFLYMGWAAVGFHMLGRGESTGATGPSSDGMIRLLEGGAHMVGSAFQFIGNVGQWIVSALATISLIILLFGLVLFLIAKGLHGRRTWARVLGILFASGLFFIAAVSVLATHRGGVLLFAAIAASSSVHAMWALWRRFA